MGHIYELIQFQDRMPTVQQIQSGNFHTLKVYRKLYHKKIEVFENYSYLKNT